MRLRGPRVITTIAATVALIGAANGAAASPELIEVNYGVSGMFPPAAVVGVNYFAGIEHAGGGRTYASFGAIQGTELSANAPVLYSSPFYDARSPRR